MRLQVQGRVQTGSVTFDYSLGATTLWQNAPGGPMLVVNSGQQGGMSTWRVQPSGEVVLLETLAYSTTGARAARDHVVLAPFRGEMVAFYGLGETTFWGQAITADGSFGARRLVSLDTARAEIAAGNTDFLRLWALMRPDPPPGRPDLAAWQNTTGIAQAGSDLVVISSTEAGLRVLPTSGPSRFVGAELGISAPSGLLVFGTGTDTRIVVAGAAGSSLSVLRLTPDGYQPSTHVLDTGSTAFARVQALAGVSVQTANGPLDLVLAGGADHGVTLFALTRDGALIWLDTLFDTAQTGLHNVMTLQASVVGGRVVVTATSQRDAGITVLSLPVSAMGGIVTTGRGGTGAEILLSGPGVTSLTGGAGADIFVIRPQTARITITDFSPGQDRLDLSAWPMLRDLAQLAYQPLTGGGMIRYRGHELEVLSATGRTLALSDIFPRGLDGIDRAVVLGADVLGAVPPPPPVPPEDGINRLIGTDAANVLRGTRGSDLLDGGGGNDTLYGMDGSDTLIGGAGDDFLFGGDSPADLRDLIYGGDGNDNIDGGHGNDELHGGNGHDTITGGFGADTVIGNAGDDVLLGAGGADLIFGGPGNDFINGGFGFDRMNGGTGADRFFHAGVADHGSDWIQDYTAAEGDVLVFGQPGATRQQFQVNTNFTPNAGQAAVAEAFVIYRPTGQILWALVDGAGQSSINLQLGGQVFDLMVPGV